MGAFCCCFQVPDVEETANQNALSNGSCLCFNSCIQSLRDKCGHLFGKPEADLSPSPNPNATYFVVAVNRASNTNGLNGIPLRSNASPRRSQSQMVQPDVVVTRPDKGSGPPRLEPEPLTESDFEAIAELLREDQSIGSEDTKKGYPESSVDVLSWRVKNEVGYLYPSSEEEDVCPTCLEDYTLENPKIVAICSHHYHLSCIYEWMERSETCPVCGKMMLFDETSGP